MLNRITVTERGQEIQKSLMNEVKEYEELTYRKKTKLIEMQKNALEESQQNIAALLGEKSQLRMVESVSKKLQLLATSNNNKNVQQHMVNLFVKDSKITQNELTPYIQSKINKFSEQTISSNFQLNGNSIHQNGYILKQQNGQLSQRISTINNTNGLDISSLSRNSIDDANLNDKYNAILNYEARIDRIMKRYRQHVQTNREVEYQVQKTYQSRREEFNEMQLKPPKKLEEMRMETESLNKIVSSNTKALESKNQRVLDAMKRKYQKVWKNTHFPKLTQKFQLMHSLHFNSQDDHNQQINISKDHQI